VKYDWLIVGAGLSGATIAERIATRGQSVLIVEQRAHVGGNAWDEVNAHGILEHKYGPHIFHTNSKEVWDYLSRFTGWRPYEHKVLASIEGKLAPIPFNLNSIDILFPSADAKRFTEKLIELYGADARVPILKLKESRDDEILFLADYVYRNVFEHYTRKQWDLRPEDLLPSVTARVPVLVSRDDRYFQDTYQAMPLNGYAPMLKKMLDHPKIAIRLNTRWQDVRDTIDYERMIYTGPLDEYFDFRHGELPYRSLRFDVKTFPETRHQEAAVINYPNDHAYTRITEQKWLTGQESESTTILTEYPQAHVAGKTIPYYPIPTTENRALCKKYEDEVEALGGKVIFIGRLADYQYYNMDQAVGRALALSRKL
jgi:UDP-galactopyranose mutase